MKSSTVVELVQAHYDGSESDFRRIVESLIDEEAEKGNMSVSMSLRRAMIPSKRSMSVSPRQSSADEIRPYPRMPRYSLDEISLPCWIRSRVEGIIEQYVHIQDLRGAGVEPVRTILIHGPPGCGKTMMAHAIASAIGTRIITVDFGSLISSYMGETGSNLASVFRIAIQEHSVLFIDEMDAIASSREDRNDNGEARRVVVSLIQNLDDCLDELTVIAATNMFNTLDPAIIRRFECVINLGIPDEAQRRDMIERYISSHFPGQTCDMDALMTATTDMTGSQVISFLDDISRRQILERGHNDIDRSLIFGTYLLFFQTDSDDENQALEHMVDLADRGVPVTELSRLSGIKYTTLNNRIKKWRSRHGGL